MSLTFLTDKDEVLRYSEQKLTEEQKAQARENIGVGAGGGSGIEVTAKPGQLIRVKETDENGKPTAWEAVPWGYTEPQILLEESDASPYNVPGLGQMWMIFNPPTLTVGETYTVTYNGESYDCACVTAPSGIVDDPNAVALGNWVLAGGADTGEPFAIVVSNKAVNVLDIPTFMGSAAPTSVRVGIKGKVAHPIPIELLPEGYPHYEYGVLLAETGAIAQTHQTLGKVWVIGEVPKVELGKTYKIKYNGVVYNRLCMADPMNTTGDPDAVCFGNLSVVGGENTGEPFIILISPRMGITVALDLVDSTSVSIGIEGDVVVPFEGKYLPGSIYTVVFDIHNDNNTWQAKADKTFSEILEKSKDPNFLVRAFVRTHAMSIYYGSLDVLFYSYGELTNAASGELNFAIKENSANNLYLKMTSDAITVSR